MNFLCADLGFLFPRPHYLIDGVEPMEYFIVDSSMKISRPLSFLCFLLWYDFKSGTDHEIVVGLHAWASTA